MITAVLFDLFETLITESGIQPTRASSLAPTLCLEKDAYRKEWKMRRPSVLRGQMSFAQALTEISQTLSGRADQTAIQAICQQRIREKAGAYAQIRDEVAAVITSLARRRVGLAVISNGFEEDVLGWSRCALADSRPTVLRKSCRRSSLSVRPTRMKLLDRFRGFLHTRAAAWTLGVVLPPAMGVFDPAVFRSTVPGIGLPILGLYKPLGYTAIAGGVMALAVRLRVNRATPLHVRAPKSSCPLA